MLYYAHYARLGFDHWTDCPPRAPINKADAVYGSFDHMMILLGRIADFSARDRKRKLRVMQANGGAWRPAPGMQMGPPPGTQTPAQATTQSRREAPLPPSSAPPGNHPSVPMAAPFYGMAPASKEGGGMPSPYQPNGEYPTKQASTADTSPPENTQDLSMWTEHALLEWGEIRDTVDLFASHLGPNFQALSAELQPPMQSPFGPAIFYRSWDISSLWAIYNMCLLILIRAHPHMPPAAHMAAGVAAYQTKDIVTTIGRIAAGIPMPPPEETLNPNLAAALCDLAVPLFFSGITYQAKGQRDWLVGRLYEIDRRAGWATAGIIAEGCQTAWIKAYAAGRGPPHERIQKANFADIRVRKYKSESLNVQGSVKVPEEEDDNDRKFIHKKSVTRLHWAVGIIGNEEDL